VSSARSSQASPAETDFAVGEIILQGHADARAAQRPRETVEEGLGLIEAAALACHQQAISSTSQPRVLNLRFCEKEGAGSELLVAFSEPVTYVAPTNGLIALSILGVAAACDVYDATPDALYLMCPQLTATSNAHVDVGMGIQGATGVPLPPLSVTVEVGKLSLNGGYRTYTRDIP
jgi:hypothetical protein